MLENEVLPRTAPPKSSRRRTAFTIATAIFAAAAAGGLFGIGLFIGWFDNEDAGIHRVHNVGFGVLFGLILTTAFVFMTRRPETKPSAYFQVVVVAAAAVVGGIVSADGGYVPIGVFVAVAAAVLLALHPARDVLLHPVTHPSPVMLAFVAIGSVPLISFALSTARLQRLGPSSDPHVSMNHWANTSAMAFAIVLTGLLAALRMNGWRFTAWCAGLGAVVYGVASIVFHRFPGTTVAYPASEGVGWGVVAVAAGLAFIALAEWEARARADVTA
jgi:hypothetical protein